MRVADLSEDRVAERLGALEEAYSSFPVNQTTLSVSGSAYERARERCTTGLADVYVQVYDDAGEVLLVESDDGLTVPHVEPGTDERLEAGTRRAIAERTGVECRLTDLQRATILGVRHDGNPEREPLYRLTTFFAAEHTAGSPGPGVAWYDDPPESVLPDH